MCNENTTPAQQRQLLVETATVAAAATSTTSGQYTLTSGRGNVKKFFISTPATTAADIAAVTVTFLVNNVQVVTNCRLDQFSSLYQNLQKFLVDYPDASVVSWQIVNTGANAVQVNFNFQYV